jgi:hypothetical protein
VTILTQFFAMAAVLAIIFIVPMVVYGVANALGGMEMPTEASPQRFLGGVLVTKLGTAVAFVLLLDFGRSVWTDRWLLYALIWFAMFAASEIGDGISARSSWREATLGIASEAIYAPAATYAAYVILGIT